MKTESFEVPVVLVGCGNMGFALLKGWVEAQIVDPALVHVVEPEQSLRERADLLGVVVHETHDTLPSEAEFVVIAIKPQVIPDLLPAYQRFARSSVFVSIAAGIETATLSSLLGGANIIRAMPNTPTAVGKGSTVMFAGAGVLGDQIATASRLFSAGGSVHQVESEAQINAATAISGSGPAYVFYLMECLSAAAVELGLPARMAQSLAVETVYGAGALAYGADADPSELRRQVTSPKGTTEAGLEVLMADDQLANLINGTAKAALERAALLSRS